MTLIEEVLIKENRLRTLMEVEAKDLEKRMVSSPRRRVPS